MAFSNIENNETLGIINIAIVDNEDFKNKKIFKETFKNLSDENNEDRIFNTKYGTEKDAKELLENNEIIGYLKIEEDNPKVIVTTSGINETVFKYVVEEITQTTEIVKNIAGNKIKEEIQEVKLKNISNSNLSYTMIEFYTLIAMACLYGGMLGMTSINQNLANMSNKGKRVAISPASKLKVVCSSVLASYITALIGLSLLFIYTIFVLKVNYGTNLLLIILLAMTGSLAGLSMGMAIGTTLKTNENTKTGILIAVTMFGCFLSGMMGITMKYIIDKNIPIINKINPASMITDGFYSLYYYDTLDRFYFNLASLLVFSGVMISISYMSLRRQKYDSI